MFRMWNQNRSPEAIAIQKSGLPIVTVFEGPSSRKSEMCQLVAQRCGYTHLSMGDLLRQECQIPDTQRTKRCKMNTEAGFLCDSVDAHEILRQHIFKNIDRKKPFIIHGYPTNPGQQAAGEADLGKATLVIVLECTDNVLATRTAIRNKLGTRPEDKPEIVYKHIQYYVKYIQPMLKDMQMQQFVMRIDANREIKQVYETVLKLSTDSHRINLLKEMSNETRTQPEKLEVPPVATFPSMLLLKKRPADMDPAAKNAEMEQLQKRGSSVLERMRNFIPQMEESERTLQQQILSSENPEQLDIEHVEEGSTAVEFNLALFEHSSSDSEDSLSSLTDSDSEADDKYGGSSRQRTVRSKPKISVCEDAIDPS